MIHQPTSADGAEIQHVLGMRHANRLLPDQGFGLVIEVTAPPGHGAPPHSHDKDEEFFYILDGELTVDLDGNRHVLRPGDSCHLPANVPHAFHNLGEEPARFLAIVTPGRDAYAFFRSVATEEPDMPTATDHLFAAATANGLTFA